MEINMSFKIVVDSCCELPEEYLQDSRFEIVPLGLEVGDYQIQDDENFDQAEFLKKVAECPKCPKSACPSPERFKEAYHTEAEHVYVITLSSHLSGSYNSAVLGMNLYREKYGKKQIHIIDSESATLVGSTYTVEAITIVIEINLVLYRVCLVYPFVSFLIQLEDKVAECLFLMSPLQKVVVGRDAVFPDDMVFRIYLFLILQLFVFFRLQSRFSINLLAEFLRFEGLRTTHHVADIVI